MSVKASKAGRMADKLPPFPRVEKPSIAHALGVILLSQASGPEEAIWKKLPPNTPKISMRDVPTLLIWCGLSAMAANRMPHPVAAADTAMINSSTPNG